MAGFSRCLSSLVLALLPAVANFTLGCLIQKVVVGRRTQNEIDYIVYHPTVKVPGWVYFVYSFLKHLLPKNRH
jgi:hypothetical protein